MAFTQEQILNKMHETGMIPVFNHEDKDVAKKVLEAAYKGGVRVFEFTNRSENALEVFKELVGLAQRFDGLILGVGTIFTAEDARKFSEAGAEFLVSPVFNEGMATACKEAGKPWIPGCGTFTEIYNAISFGAPMVKVFPGSVLGPGFISSVKAVRPDVKIMPTGGVKPERENLKSWFKAGVHCVGMGSKLFDKHVITEGQWDLLKEDVEETMEIVREVRS